MNDPLDFSHFENAYAQQQQRPRERLNLRFYIEPIENKAKSLEAGRPIFDNIEFVAINVPGSRDEVVKKINAEVKARFQGQYEMWKKTMEQPVDGTPLTMVPFLNPAQIREYQALNVMTLEQLAELSDIGVQKLGPGALEARRKAQTYMKAGSDSALTQRLLAENEVLKKDLAQMTGQVAQLSQRLEALIAQGGGAATPAPQLAGQPALDVQAMIRDEIRKALQQ